MKKKIIRIIIFTLIIVGLGFYMKSRGMVLGIKADVVGNLRFTYPHGLTPETLFNETDFKPGDCQTATVIVKNLVASNSVVGVFSDGETESDGLSSALTIEVNDGTNTLYGPLPLSAFFADSDVLNQIKLLTLTGNASANLNFKVCFPNTGDNELQGDSVVFDLNFGQITPPIELPEECKELEGIVTEKIEGTDGNDYIHGTTANELILAKGGNDYIHPSSGSDCIIAGDGNDTVIGTTGNEIIVGGGGNDRLDGGTGNDKIYGNEGDDFINGGTGYDELFGGDGNDIISGGSNDDKLYGLKGDDTLIGGSGNDFLDGGPGIDNLNGNSGTDTCLNGETLISCEQ